ncbi:hypothetical protein [Paenibacillus harenae]|uniref:hypothetical protein n=1 Tax=Paenibacillus harenae TaxID=306543 RepID=UPI00041F067D|nr:hypothetical protein [Paenibacillus harenae]
MEQQPAGKRPIALPVTLVLLVFSLVGNVFLYSQSLQNMQGNKFEAGERIFTAAAESRQYFEELVVQLDALLASELLEKRAEIKYDAGKISQKGRSVVLLAEEAQKLNGNGNSEAEIASAYIKNVDSSLQSIGNYEGPLNDPDIVNLQALKQSASSLAGVMSGFNLKMKDNRTAIIRLASGAEWLDLMDELQRLMSEQVSK